MAEALAGGLLASGVARERLLASDVDEARRRAFAAGLGVAAGGDNPEVVRRSDVVVLAVKPGAIAPVLAELGRAASAELSRVLWISIAAGVPLAVLEAGLAAGSRVVRAMPN